VSALLLRWRQRDSAIVTAWRGMDAAMVDAIAFAPDLPVAAIVGPPGAAASSFEHVQSVASASWTVNHNLGRWPSAVTIVSPGGVEVDATVTHVTTAQLTIEFASPFAGRARII